MNRVLADKFIVVRTPQKLFDLLDSRGIPPATVKDRLTIIGGNAKDGSAVEKTLVDENGRLVDQIVFGIGRFPFQVVARIRPMTML